MRQKSIAADASESTLETSATIDIWDILAKMVHIYAMTPDQLLDLPNEYFLQLLNKMPMIESNEALCLVTHLMRAIFGDADTAIDTNVADNTNGTIYKNNGSTNCQPKSAQMQDSTIYVTTPEELRSALAALGGI